ncbi:MAG TPA: AAA family ATPase [Ramlibacter sp.]|jgi:hypothetical protein
MHQDHTNFSSSEQSPPNVARHAVGDEVVAFLSRIPGTHHLVAIDPFADPKKRTTGDVEGLTCNPVTDADKIREWVNARNGQKNLHWTVNEVRSDFHGNKATKKDIVRARFAHLDVDLDGANTAHALSALLDATTEKLPVGLEPSIVVASGGGYQLLFALDEQLGCDDQARLAIEAQNRGLICLLNGDASTWNVDRLFRLPATENVPNAKKLGKGRVQRTAELLDANAERYTLAQLAEKVPPISIQQRASTEPKIAEAWAELDGGFYEQCCTEADLPAETRGKLHQALSQGNDRFREFWVNGTGETSGRKAALASFLGWRGVHVTVEEFAQLMWCWGFTHEGPEYCDSNLSARALARAYVNTYLNKIPMREERDEQHDKLKVDVEKVFDRDAARSQALQDLMKGIYSVSKKIDPKTIPLREWLVSPRLPIGDAAQVAGEPGVSKSTFTLQDALAVSTGNERILRGENNVGPDRLFRTGPVILYNAEDRLDEMQRRLTAMQDFYGIKDAPHKIHLWSGVDNTELKLMERKPGTSNPLVRAAGAYLLEEMIVHTGAVLVILDPQVSLARGAIENSTEDGNDLFQMLARMATKLKISILVVHHTAKHTRNDHGDMGAGRGAFSVMGKVRSAFTLVNVTEGEAKEWGYPPGDDLVRLDYAKVSHGRKPKTATVYRRRSMLVGNGTGIAGDAAPFAGTALEHFRAVGDDAPVFEVVGLGVKPGDAPEPLSQGQARRIAVAEAVAKVLGEREAVGLPTVYHEIGGALNEAGISKSTSRPAITDLVKTSLAGRGVQIMHGGQNVWVNAEQRGIGPTAPWFLVIRREGLEALKALEAEGVFS